MKIGYGLAAALCATTAFGAVPADGFAAFWTPFVGAAVKDDTKALAGMTALGPALGDDGTSFAKFHSRHLGPAVRRCLAKAKPLRDVDPQGGVSYSVFCGDVIYVFSRTGGAWKLTDLGAND